MSKNTWDNNSMETGEFTAEEMTTEEKIFTEENLDLSQDSSEVPDLAGMETELMNEPDGGDGDLQRAEAIADDAPDAEGELTAVKPEKKKKEKSKAEKSTGRKAKKDKAKKAEAKKEAKAKKEAAPKGQDGKTGFSLNVSIKLQLLVGFIIPIIFVILVGIVSYKKAEEGMIANYEESAQNTLDTQVEYLDFGLSMIRGDALQIKLDSELQSLVAGTYDTDVSKSSSVYSKQLSALTVKSTLNKFILNMYVVPRSSHMIIVSGNGSLGTPGYYEQWVTTEEAEQVIKGQAVTWLGSHPEIDELGGINTDDYILSYVSVFPNNGAFIAADISTAAVRESLEKIDTTEGAMIGFVTADGRQILVKGEDNENEIDFPSQQFYQECAAAEETSGIQYIDYDGEDYLFIYSRSEETGATLVYMVPESKVTASAAAIRWITVLLVIIACIVAALAGLLISYNISSSMNSIIRRLKKAAEGDLTVRMKTQGRSEFSTLNRHIADMVGNTRKLIQDVEGIVDMVDGAASNVEEVSEQMEGSFASILDAIGEIDTGVTQQAEDAQECLIQMDGLSQTIESINGDMEKTAENSQATKGVVSKSISTMDELSRQTQDTIQVTAKVREDIQQLEKHSAEIRSFVDIISDIAEQTNLLSLNASIEAARAGEAGKGFAVVAEEIRKLADGSHSAASEINKVVGAIEAQTRETVETAAKAGKIVEQQAQSVDETRGAFEEINSSTEQIISGVLHVANQVSSMDQERAGTLEAISSISAVSEQTAASSTNVYNIAQEQKSIVVSLRQASAELKEKMQELREAISVFTTN